MVDPTLVISIDCTGMADPTPLVFHASGVDGIAITDYREPSLEPLNLYASKSEYEDGQDVRGATWLNSLLGWDFKTDQATTEQASRLVVARTRLVIARLRYEVTVTTEDADPEVWQVAGRGSLVGPERTLMNLVNHDPVWALSLPIKPNPVVEVEP